MKKIIVAVVVYDRIENIKLWVNSWKQCEQHDAELVVIQNLTPKNLTPSLSKGEGEGIENFCKENDVKYIARENVGYDIGAFQDVCKERLQGFDNDWETLLWCTDDTLPMRKDFLAPFLKKIKGGIACAYLSPYVKRHIRTTGFAITKALASKLEFDKDPIVTKEDCYQFEHRGKNIFFGQVTKMKLPVTQVESWNKSPLWDQGYKRLENRMEEFEKVFSKPELIASPRPRPNGSSGRASPKGEGEEEETSPRPSPKGEGGEKKVAFLCAAYNSYPQIISSLICQTYQNWELFVLHDGPNQTNMQEQIKDPRIHYIETPERIGKWGHHLRQWGLENLDKLCPDAEYVVITNADNYHVPTYTEYLVKALDGNPNMVAAYCSDMGHSYKAWKIIPCRLQLGYIDCAGVMVRKEAACKTGWRDIESHSSDWTYFSDIIKTYGANRWIKVDGCLLIHN